MIGRIFGRWRRRRYRRWERQLAAQWQRDYEPFDIF